MPSQDMQNRNEVKEVKFHHKVKRFYHKNLFRKIYTVAIIGLIGANIFSMVKYASFADELLGLEPISLEEETINIDEGIGDESISLIEPENLEGEEENYQDELINGGDTPEDLLELGEYMDADYIQQTDISIQGEGDTTTTLKTGQEFNQALKRLYNSSATYDTSDNNIKSIVRSSTPGGGVNVALDGEIPVYVRSGDDGVVYYNTEADIVKLNSDSNLMFYNMKGGLKRLDIEDWDTSSVTNMISMFYYTTISGDLNLSDWETSKVTNMGGMFAYVTISGDLDLSNWDTSSVTNMGSMFRSATISGDLIGLSNWNTSSVTNMGSMFRSATISGNLDLSNWNTSSVTNMSEMFWDATISGDLIGLSNWDTSRVTNMSRMFAGIAIGGDLYLNNWDMSSVKTMEYMLNSVKIRGNLNLSGWNISSVNNKNYIFNYAKISGDLILNNWNMSGVTNIGGMFKSTTIDGDVNLSNWNTSSVTSMQEMFNETTIGGTLIGLNNWDTSSVTNMSSMFYSATISGDLNLSNLDTSSVIYMGGMFYSATISGDLNLSNLDTSSVTNMGSMFYSATISGDLIGLSNWDTSRVTNMSRMFLNVKTNSGLNLSKWDTSSVTSMNSMFYLATISGDLNLSNWNTSSVTDMSEMFQKAKIPTIYATSGLDTSKVTSSSSLFTNSQVVGGNGTVCNTALNTSYLRIDRPGEPGCFTFYNPCEEGYHPDGDQCVNVKTGACTPVVNPDPNATYAETGNYAWSGDAWIAPECTVASCNGDYHLDNGICVNVKTGACTPVVNPDPNVTYAETGNYAWSGDAWIAPECTIASCNGKTFLLNDGTCAVFNDLELYFLQSDGSTGHYTLMDRNIGATDVYNGTWGYNYVNTNSGSYGYYYKWGNNRGYVKGDEYFSNAGVGVNDWRIDSKGPCPTGYHVPTSGEFKIMVGQWKLGKNYIANYIFALDWLLPPSGSYSTTNGTAGCALSSSRNSSYVYYLTYSSSLGIVPDFEQHGYYGLPIRCMKDSTNAGISINPNGGTTAVIAFTGTVGNGRFTTLDAPTRADGAIFDGWYDEDDNKIETGDIVVSDLYAKWTVRYTVTFDATANGGTTSTPTVEVTPGETKDLSGYTAAKTGYDFLGWSTTSGSHTPISTNYNNYPVTSDITLYAIFKRTLTANFVLQDNNAANLSSSTSKCEIYNNEPLCTLTAPSLTAKAGYTVDGWSTDGGTTVNANNYRDGNTYYSVTHNNTPLTITFNSNGNQVNGEPSPQCYKYNGNNSCPITSPNILSVNNFSVIGWSTEGNKNNHSNDWPANTSKDVTTNATYYAQTKKDGYTVNVSYTKGNGVKSIGKTSNSCNVADIYNGVEYQSCEVTMPSITCKSGYNTPQWSNGESGNTDISVLSDTSYEATCLASDDTRYTVNHYQQNIKDNNYTLFETESKTGTTDTKTQAVAKNYQGFKSKSFTQKDIQGDTETVVDIYYDRNEYKVTFYDEDGETVLKSMKKYRYGTKVSDMEIPTPTKPSSGTNTFVFNGWLPQLGDVQKDVEYIAQYRLVVPSQTSNYSGGGKRKTDSNTNNHNAAETNNEKTNSKDTPTELNNDTKDSSVKSPEGQNEKISQDDSKGEKIDLDSQRYDATYTTEQNQAYHFARSNKITTTSSIKEAKMNTPLTRIEMAKMLSQYAMNVLGQAPDTSKGIVKFKDVTNKMNSQYDNGVILAYQLGIMGINMPNNKFRPNDTVTRGEFATALSRMIYDMEDGKGKLKYYEPHIARLYNEGIINNTNPKMLEQRGYVMTMLMRASE